jgi:DNA polymerase III delta prime subunit
MQSLIDLYKQGEVLHHAYFVVSHKVEEAVEKLKKFFKESVGIETEGNPDFHHLKFDTMTVDDARGISEKEMVKNLGDGRKVFLIETDFMTEEAQNSLLKIFEEPREGTHFFIVSPQEVILPTLKSRMQVISHDTEETEGESVVDLPLSARMEKVKEIAEAIADEEETKQGAIAFVNGIEKELYARGVEKESKSLEACESARQALFDRGAPVKMILENLMLVI